jgi:hypothetical protein
MQGLFETDLEQMTVNGSQQVCHVEMVGWYAVMVQPAVDICI